MIVGASIRRGGRRFRGPWTWFDTVIAVVGIVVLIGAISLVVYCLVWQ